MTYMQKEIKELHRLLKDLENSAGEDFGDTVLKKAIIETM